MSVGTIGAVRGVTGPELVSAGCEIVLGNTFHLFLRPGLEVVELHGDLHSFMHWPNLILTDSGGFQVYSIEGRKISEAGVKFKSNVNGDELFLGPEESMAIQRALGSDIVMAFDECVAFGSPPEQVEAAVERTRRWAVRSKAAHGDNPAALFGIVQGGFDVALRERSLKGLTEIGFDGYAIGGVSVGEPHEELVRITRATVQLGMPADRPRYLMGVGFPRDIVEAVCCGIDMFDCIIPSKHAQHGIAFVPSGQLRITNSEHKMDLAPLDSACACAACAHGYSRSWLRHMFKCKEALAVRLLTLHNLFYYQRLMADLRAAIASASLHDFVDDFYAQQGLHRVPQSS